MFSILFGGQPGLVKLFSGQGVENGGEGRMHGKRLPAFGIVEYELGHAGDGWNFPRRR